ncbi:MAG TPA: hypothetical protein VM925_09930 [Labilithrix sp.]|nr:hypothetical protein [Labilithrix sp.]
MLVVLAAILPFTLVAVGEVIDLGVIQGLAVMVAFLEVVGFFFLPAIAPDGILNGEQRGPVRADRTGVFFRRKLVLPRKRIGTPWVEALDGGARRVHLSGTRARDDLSIVVENDARAESLLEALELRHDRHAASFVVESAPLRTPAMQRVVRTLVFLGSALLATLIVVQAYSRPAIGFLLVPAIVVYSMIVRRLTSRLVVGADGFVVHAGGVLRQIAHTSVRNVSAPRKAETTVELVSGDTLTFRFAGKGATDKCHAFVTSLKESIAHVEHAPSPVVALLQPAGRSASQWLEDLRRLTGDSVAYRGGSVPDEELWRVVEHASADSGARAGAVAALRPRLDETGRARINELAEATAGQALKAALEAAAAGESDERILDAFDRMSRPRE